MKILIEENSVRKVYLDNGEKWNLKGECNRCGVCCEEMKMPVFEFADRKGKCKKVKYETLNGEKVATCRILWSRPAACLLYPKDPYEELPKECSYTWKKISG